MSKHPIDELFRKNLAKLEEEYPQHLWQGVADRLGRSRRPKRVLWLRWTSMVLFMLMAIAGGIYLSGDQIDQNSSIQNGDHRNVIKGGSVDGDIQDDDLEEKSNMAMLSDDEFIGGADVDQNTSSISGSTGSDLSDKVDEQRGSERVQSRQSIGSRTATPSFGRNNEVAKQRLNDRSTLGQSEKLEVGFTTYANANQGSTSSNVSVGLDMTVRSGESLEMARIGKLEAGGIKYALLDKASERLMKRHFRKSIGYGKNRMVLKWGIAGVYSTEFAVRQMTNRTQEGLALLNYRDDNERFVNAYSTGIEVSLKWHQLSFITGLIYSQVNDEYTFIQDNTERIINGVVVQGRYEQRIINRYTSYELPIIVQFEMSKGRWVLGAGVGLHLGLHYSTSGKIFDSNALAAVDLESEDGSVYRDRLSAAPVLSMMAGYKMGYRSLIFLRPSVRHYLEPLTREEYSLDQRQQILSLTAGIRYTLN